MADTKLHWTNALDLPLEGKGWSDTKDPYDRLPAKAEGVVPDPVWNLGKKSAGLCVRFVTDAEEIHARWTLNSNSLAMDHMPATGVSGLDLYVNLDDMTWRWIGVGRPTETPTNTTQLVGGIHPESREYILYLPLYNGVTSVEIGTPSERKLEGAPGRNPSRKPIVFYGTSITQGGCASRTGMAYPAILGRRLSCPTINLGFSGSGRMEPEMADLIAELDASIFFLDCLPNMRPEEVTERVAPFVRTLRASHSETPIVLVEGRTYTNSFLVESARIRNEQSSANLFRAYNELLEERVGNLHYIESGNQLGLDGEATVDSSHPTDLGFVRQADAFGPLLSSLLH